MKVWGPAKTWGIYRLERGNFAVERLVEEPSDSEESGHAKVSSCVGDFGNLLWDCCAVWETGEGEEGLNAENAGRGEEVCEGRLGVEAAFFGVLVGPPSALGDGLPTSPPVRCEA